MKLTAEDKRTCGMAADGLLERADYQHLLRRPGPKRTRKPSLRRMVAAAEKTGKSVTSVTLPDGTVLHFGGEPVTEATNPWPLTDFTKVKQ